MFAYAHVKFNIISYMLPRSSRTESIHFFPAAMLFYTQQKEGLKSCQLFHNALSNSRSSAFRTTTVGCRLVQCRTKLALLEK